MLTSPATSSAIINALENAFEYLTTIALVGLVVAHVMMNTSVMTLFGRLKEKHFGFHKVMHPIQHYLLPGIATAIFAFVLYESIIPPVFPVTEAVATGALYLAGVSVYAYWIKKTKPQVLKNAGRRVNIVEEELLEAKNKEDKNKKG